MTSLDDKLFQVLVAVPVQEGNPQYYTDTHIWDRNVVVVEIDLR